MVNGETFREKATRKGKPEVSPAGQFGAEKLTAEEDFQYDAKELDRLYEETLKSFEEGEVVLGTVIQINNNEVLVDVGYKSEGSIPLSEFGAPQHLKLKVGDQIEVYLEKKEDNNGLMVLSKE